MTAYWVTYRDEAVGVRYMRAVDAADEALIYANTHRLSPHHTPATVVAIKPMSEDEMRVFPERLYL